MKYKLIIPYEYIEHQAFTFKQSVQTCFNTLKGVIEGILADGVIREKERVFIKEYCNNRSILKNKKFSPMSLKILSCLKKNENGRIRDQKEFKEILDICSEVVDKYSYYNELTKDIQKIHGFLSGIIADEEVNTAEAKMLKEKFKKNLQLTEEPFLKEIYLLLEKSLQDFFIDKRESKELLEKIESFVPTSKSMNSINVENLKNKSKKGRIVFPGNKFCITGKFKNHKRAEIKNIIKQLGGTYKNGVCQKTDYLIIGTDGNPCYSYDNYGRKVEKAKKLERKGYPIKIIGEVEFLDEIKDQEV